MCYDDNARPPITPGEDGTAHGEDIVLTAADGNRFSAYIAHPTHPKDAQILIYPDIRGLHHFYKELALRFAEIGITALAIDYFGRTAGLTARDDSFEFRPHVMQVTLETFFSDVDAALSYLQQDGQGKRSTFIIGFCFGGTFSLVSATRDIDLAGAIAFYAGLARNFGGGPTVLEQAASIKHPVLGLFGGADQGIPVEQVEQLDQTLTRSGVEHEIKVYEGAPHSFFDRQAATFAAASADAWTRVQHFIDAHQATVATH
jgi:carboxymethylenebutenolidase